MQEKLPPTRSIKGEEPKPVKRRPGKKDVERIPRDMRAAGRGGSYKTR